MTMIKFFRIIRQKLVQENRVGKYLLYAVGEIILVIIGIMIAVWLNNLNAAKNEDKKIQTIFKEIQNELILTIEDLEYTIEYYRNKDSLIYEFMMNDLKKEDFRDTTYRILMNISTNYNIPVMQEEGFNNLMLKSENMPDKYDSIAKGLKYLYISLKNDLDTYSDEMHELVKRTLLYQEENYAWFADATFKIAELNDEELEYTLHDKHYKNSVAQYSIYGIFNLVNLSRNVRIAAIKNVKAIDNLLGKEQPYSFDLNVDDYTAWNGKYHYQGDTIQIVVDDKGINWHAYSGWEEVYPLSPTQFHTGDIFFYRFMKDEQGEITGLKESGIEVIKFWEKIKEED